MTEQAGHNNNNQFQPAALPTLGLEGTNPRVPIGKSHMGTSGDDDTTPNATANGKTT